MRDRDRDRACYNGRNGRMDFCHYPTLYELNKPFTWQDNTSKSIIHPPQRTSFIFFCRLYFIKI